jgi:hypothetical protein
MKTLRNVGIVLMVVSVLASCSCAKAIKVKASQCPIWCQACLEDLYMCEQDLDQAEDELQECKEIGEEL